MLHLTDPCSVTSGCSMMTADRRRPSSGTPGVPGQVVCVGLTFPALRWFHTHFPSAPCWLGSEPRRAARRRARCGCPAASETSSCPAELSPAASDPAGPELSAKLSVKSKPSGQLPFTVAAGLQLHVSVVRAGERTAPCCCSGLTAVTDSG